MVRRDIRQFLATKSPVESGAGQKVLEEEDFSNAHTLGSILEARAAKVVPSRQLIELLPVDDTPWKDSKNNVLLTIKQVGRMFDVTTMTLYHWVAKRGFPKTTLPGGRNPPARYDEGQLLVWAKFNSREVVNTDYLELC